MQLAIHVQIARQGIQKVTLAPAPSLQCHFISNHRDPEIERQFLLWLDAYMQKKTPKPLLPLQLPELPDFTRKVLHYLATIPFGSTVSYQHVAQELGSPLACRAVGNACRINPLPLLLPCHRVIATNGRLGGFAYGNALKQTLLNHEQVF